MESLSLNLEHVMRTLGNVSEVLLEVLRFQVSPVVFFHFLLAARIESVGDLYNFFFERSFGRSRISGSFYKSLEHLLRAFHLLLSVVEPLNDFLLLPESLIEVSVHAYCRFRSLKNSLLLHFLCQKLRSFVLQLNFFLYFFLFLFWFVFY